MGVHVGRGRREALRVGVGRDEVERGVLRSSAKPGHMKVVVCMPKLTIYTKVALSTGGADFRDANIRL